MNYRGDSKFLYPDHSSLVGVFRDMDDGDDDDDDGGGDDDDGFFFSVAA